MGHQGMAGPCHHGGVLVLDSKSLLEFALVGALVASTGKPQSTQLCKVSIRQQCGEKQQDKRQKRSRGRLKSRTSPDLAAKRLLQEGPCLDHRIFHQA